MDRLDLYERRPSGMEKYLSTYGWNFSKAMCHWAISMMKDRNDNKISEKTKEQVNTILANHSITLEHDKGYNAVYVMHSCMADFLGSSVPDESFMAKNVKDVIDDKDGYEGMVFTRFYADCLGKGIPIIWEDMM